METKPVLYIKPGCPWCSDAVEYFDQNGVEVDIKDVLRDREAMERMIEISSQTLTPTFEYNGFVVPDFSVKEFQQAIAARPDLREELGLKARQS